jgi:hypothetical protein
MESSLSNPLVEQATRGWQGAVRKSIKADPQRKGLVSYLYATEQGKYLIS